MCSSDLAALGNDAAVQLRNLKVRVNYRVNDPEFMMGAQKVEVGTQVVTVYSASLATSCGKRSASLAISSDLVIVPGADWSSASRVSVTAIFCRRESPKGTNRKKPERKEV